MNEILAISRRTAGPRQRVIMAATLFTPDGVQRVRIRDLSPSGAKLVSELPLSGATDAIFKRGSLFAAARIVWTNGCETGLKFYRPLMVCDITGAIERS